MKLPSSSAVLPVIVCVMATGLLIQNRVLLSRNSRLRSTVTALTRSDPSVGDTIPWVIGVDANGGRAAFDFGESAGATLLLGMSVSCRFCLDTIPAWSRLSDKAKARGFRVIVVAKDRLPDLAPFMDSLKRVNGDLVADPTYATYASMRMDTVPITSIVGLDGKLSHVWIGVLDSEREMDVSKVLDAVRSYATQ